MDNTDKKCMKNTTERPDKAKADPLNAVSLLEQGGCAPLVGMMGDYGDSDYWDRRYQTDPDARYEWYQPYKALRPLLRPYLAAFHGKSDEVEILVTGCGNSALSEEMYAEGYHNITNIDTSTTVIQQQQRRRTKCTDMEYCVMDAADLQVIPEGVFNVIIDKGMTDAVLCGKEGLTKIEKVTAEMHRVLKPGGTLVVVSHGVPASRLCYFQKSTGFTWHATHAKLPKPDVANFADIGASPYHFVYFCTKPK